jgi:lipopolysaccharide export system permease protein
MTLVDRHVLREWLGILGLVLAATLGLLVMHSLYDELEDLLREGAGVAEVVAYCLVKVPGFLATLLPLCLLVSLLYALGRLHHANEITALRAAGLGLGRITRSIWVVAVLACGLVWWLNASVVPWSVEEARRLRESLQTRRISATAGSLPGEAGARPAVTFENPGARRLWFINRYSQFTERAHGVTVSQLGPDGREDARWLAREGWLDPRTRAWHLRDGRELSFDPVTGELLRTTAFRDLPRPGWTEDPQLMQVYDARPDTLSLFELRRVLAHHEAIASPKALAYALRQASLLAEPLMPLVIVAFAIPFAVAGVRVNPAVGVSKALGLFVIYFIALRLGLVLGGRGLLAPMGAALLPHGALLAAGAWAWSRVR